jgi:hypothetical protein
VVEEVVAVAKALLEVKVVLEVLKDVLRKNLKKVAKAAKVVKAVKAADR